MDFHSLLLKVAAHYKGALVPHPLQPEVFILQLNRPRRFRLFLQYDQPSQVWILFPVIPAQEHDSNLRSLLKNRQGKHFTWRFKRNRLFLNKQPQSFFCLNTLSNADFDTLISRIDSLITEAIFVLDTIKENDDMHTIKQLLTPLKTKRRLLFLRRP